ncbi:MAG: hypothetical protein LBU83_07415, partial [Bacteroidales bacterium]|nr:hypothetical protein [Bacteroidales bacterium]
MAIGNETMKTTKQSNPVKSQKKADVVVSASPFPLLSDIRELIEASRQRVAIGVNAELSLLYWSVGERINKEVLGDERA